MSNADELLTDIRQARRDLDEAVAALDRAESGDSNDAEIAAGQRVAEVALILAGRIGQLDDHMNAGATPPADWPAGRILPAGWRDLLHRAILASGVATATGVNLGAVSNAEAMANAIAAQIIQGRIGDDERQAQS